MSGCLNKLGSQLNIKEKDKTREIKRKIYIFLKQATWPPVLAHCALVLQSTDYQAIAAEGNKLLLVLQMPQYEAVAPEVTKCYWCYRQLNMKLQHQKVKNCYWCYFGLYSELCHRIIPGRSFQNGINQKTENHVIDYIFIKLSSIFY